MNKLVIGVCIFAFGLLVIFVESQTHYLRGDNEKVWWITNACPTGVSAPCLDNHVSLSQLPLWAR
jgi:hypothetical protein